MQILYETIKEILSTGRVGIPVFMRCTVQIAPKTEDLEDVLVRMLATVCSWLEASPLRVYARSDRDWTQITATTQYAGGQSSIVSVNTSSGDAPGLDLMLLGNKGALYHDSEALHPEFDIAMKPTSIPESLADAVARSLSNGEPADVEEVEEVEDFE